MVWVSYAELRELLGAEAAASLCRTFGGVRHYVPEKARPDHPFAPIIGMAAFRVLCTAYGSEKIVLPNGKKPEPKKSEIITRLEQGQSPRSIALALEVTERWVWAVAETQRSSSRQLNLFEDS